MARERSLGRRRDVARVTRARIGRLLKAAYGRAGGRTMPSARSAVRWATLERAERHSPASRVREVDDVADRRVNWRAVADGYSGGTPFWGEASGGPRQGGGFAGDGGLVGGGGMGAGGGGGSEGRGGVSQPRGGRPSLLPA